MSRRTRALALYVAIAYGVTWAIWLPYLRAALQGTTPPNAFLFYAAGAGPLVAAVVAEAYERGRPGVVDLLGRLVSVRRPGWWAAVGLLSPLLLVPAAALPLAVAGQGWPAWDGFGVSAGRAPGLGPAATWLLMTVSYGVGEETGWRGFLQSRLQSRRSALRAAMLLVPIWAAWHLPTFWFREGYVGLGPVGLVGFAIGLAAGAVVLAAMYNASGGSILAAALWHGTWNWVATSDGLQGPWVGVMTVVILVAAPVLVWRWGAGLSRGG